jgi:hypothetical protein
MVRSRCILRKKGPAARRGGLTMVDVVVLIVVVLLAGCLFLPACVQGTNCDRKPKCSNNLSNLGLALQVYASRHRDCFPPGLTAWRPIEDHWITGGKEVGAIRQGPNWLMAILDQMEERRMADQVRECLAKATIESSACDDFEEMFQLVRSSSTSGPGSSTPGSLLCPRAPRMTRSLGGTGWHDFQPQLDLENLSKGNYAGNIGIRDYQAALAGFDKFDRSSAGMFQVHMIKPIRRTGLDQATLKAGLAHGVRVSQVSDGLSCTVAVSEVLGYDSVTDSRGVWALFAPGASAFTALHRPNSPQPDQVAICDETIPVEDRLHCTENRKDGNLWASARSAHPGGVNVVYADRRVSFITDDVDLKVWRAICTRAGQENIPPP